MSTRPYQVFLSYAQANRDVVQEIATKLQGDARVQVWFAPWHLIRGGSSQEQMNKALEDSSSCAVFLGGLSPTGFQNKQLQLAIQRQTEIDPDYRVIPVLLPGVPPEIPGFLKLYEPVYFPHLKDEGAYRYMLSGIFGIAPIHLEGFLQERIEKEKEKPGAHPKGFRHGHALSIGISNYTHVNPLRGFPLNDASDLAQLLIDPQRCGYPPEQVKFLPDAQATREGIHTELNRLAVRAGSDDTAVIFFSGHGYRSTTGNRQYLLPVDADLTQLDSTAISMEELSEWLSKLRARRLLVLLDCCHAGGAAQAKSGAATPPGLKPGLSEEQLGMLVTGQGRVVIASCREDEASYAKIGDRNSMFTRFLLQALRGEGPTLGDGLVRSFDLFRHVSTRVPPYAAALTLQQHPLFKGEAMDADFGVAACPP